MFDIVFYGKIQLVWPVWHVQTSNITYETYTLWDYNTIALGCNQCFGGKIRFLMSDVEWRRYEGKRFFLKSYSLFLQTLVTLLLRWILTWLKVGFASSLYLKALTAIVKPIMLTIENIETFLSLISSIDFLKQRT